MNEVMAEALINYLHNQKDYPMNSNLSDEIARLSKNHKTTKET